MNKTVEKTGFLRSGKCPAIDLSILASNSGLQFWVLLTVKWLVGLF